MTQVRHGALILAVFAVVGCDDNGPASTDPAVVLANHSVTPALVKNLPAGVTAYALISSDDNLSEAPAFVFGGSADGAGVLKNADGTFSIVTNHEDNFAVSRVRLDRTFKPVSGQYILNSTAGRWRLCSATLATPEEHGLGRTT